MQKKWWYGKIAYQIYPRSFKDSNGDGIGDLKGIISKLDYLKDLGVDIIWLSPVYVSPQIDNGYDIADYRSIGKEFGSMDDFKELLSGVHAKDMKLIMDLVVNHCSSEHELFKKALADPYGPEGQCFYFVKGHEDGTPPDNLRSYFGGSVWEKVTGFEDLWYLHYFAKEQPDLNWYNPALRQRVYDMMNWWLDLGIDGFRVDAIMNIAKDLTFPGLAPDDEGDGMCACGRMTAKLADKAPALLKDMRDHTYGPRGAFTVGEAFGLNPEILNDIYGKDGAFSSVFDFTVRELFEKKPGYYAYEKPSVKLYRDGNFKGQDLAMKTGMVSVITENHDEPRAVSFYLRKDLQNAQGAKVLATAFLFLRGLPFIYQGQELGMTKTDFNEPGEFRDLLSFTEYQKCLKHGFSKKQALECVSLHTRDQSRTPMLWDKSKNAGFSDGTPWIRLHQDWKKLNVSVQGEDPDSVLNWYKTLIRIRKSPDLEECFACGAFAPLPCPDDSFMAYRRYYEKKEIRVYANFSEKSFTIKDDAALIVSTGDITRKDGSLMIGPGSAAVTGRDLK